MLIASFLVLFYYEKKMARYTEIALKSTNNGMTAWLYG